MAELSGFEVLALLKEISSTLHGAYINNIYSSGTSQLIRLRKPDAEDVWLVASPRRGVWVSRKVTERGETNEFTSRLRRELERSRFKGASQVDLDRVFELAFEGRAPVKLVVELMPPGNIIVVDTGGRVVTALTEVRSKNRRVVRGEGYEPPRQTRLSPADVTATEVEAMLREENTVGRAIGRHVALPRKYVAEVLARLGLGDGSPSSGLAGRGGEVAGVLKALVSEARDDPRPCVCLQDGAEEIFVVPPRGAEVVARSESVSDLCDSLFLEGIAEGEEPPSPEEGKRKELGVTIARLKSESDSLLARAGKLRSAARNAAAAPLQEALGALREAGVQVVGEPASPSAVASVLFGQAKELERRSSEALLAAAKLEKRLSKVVPKESRKPRELPRRRQEWFERFRWFLTSGGKLAVGGRDAQSNTVLIRRHLADGDVVYHADLFGSPFFILKDGLRQSEQEILELSQATVSFSSGWKTGLGAADAYWVLKDQVSASPESGEYLARGSFVIRGKKNFVRHAMIQVAVGLDGSGRVMAGPESAVANSCPGYVVVVPHREKTSDTAKKVARELSDLAGGAPGPALDDVVRALPAGGGKVVRRKQRTPA